MFSIEEVYGVSRQEYCNITGITYQELISHLEAEIIVLKANYERISIVYRSGEGVASTEQRKRVELLSVIYKKIQDKSAKIKDIKKEFENE